MTIRPVVDMSDPSINHVEPPAIHPDTYAPEDARERAVIEALRQVFDPEIPVNIYDLGLIYSLAVDEVGNAHVRMSLTAPGCPVAGTLPGEVATAAETAEGVVEATVELVWEPAWDKDRMSEDAKLALGFY